MQRLIPCDEFTARASWAISSITGDEFADTDLAVQVP